MSTACCRGHFSRMKNRARGCRVRVPFLSVMVVIIDMYKETPDKDPRQREGSLCSFLFSAWGEEIQKSGEGEVPFPEVFPSVFHLNDREWCPRSVMRIPDRYFLLKKGTCRRQVPKKFRIFPYVGIVQIRFRVQTVQPVLSPLLRAPLCFLIRYCSILPCVRQEKQPAAGLNF